MTAGARVRRPSHGPGSLLEIAVGAFNNRGYDATSMEDLSRAAGITKSSFYHHFASKEALLRAALERALDGLFALLDDDAAHTGSPLTRLRHIVEGQVQLLVDELPYVTLLLRVRGNTETERWALERRREFDAQIAALVGDAVDAGEIRAGVDPALAARLLSGLVNSVVEWARPGRGAAAPAESGLRQSGLPESGPRESGPRESGPRESGPRESGPRESGLPAAVARAAFEGILPTR